MYEDSTWEPKARELHLPPLHPRHPPWAARSAGWHLNL
eukprot:SAG11_NODE_8480_length_1010_cov_1.475302_2_plen_37_part_01